MKVEGGNQRGITRRIFGLWAAAPFLLTSSNAATAQSLPYCSDSTSYGSFTLYAIRYNDGSSVYSASYSNARVRSSNRIGYVNVRPLEYVHERSSGGEEDRLYISFDTDSAELSDGTPEPVVAPGDSIFFEIYTNGQRIYSTTLAADQMSAELLNGNHVIPQLWSGDSTLRLTLGNSYYDWTLNGGEFYGAIQRAAGLLATVQLEYQNGACTPESSAPCLLTTVSCRCIGLKDDCYELRAMRRLRDLWLVDQPFGADALSWYRTYSKVILATIPDEIAISVFARFYVLRLVPAVIAECLGFHALAYSWLKRGVKNLHTRYVNRVVK